MYKVKINRKLERNIIKLPKKVQLKFERLVDDLIETGPIQHNWPNYSKLEENTFHCHLGYNWVACWKSEKGTLFIEVHYVGSREKAPY